jgi:hypothetical protein
VRDQLRLVQNKFEKVGGKILWPYTSYSVVLLTISQPLSLNMKVPTTPVAERLKSSETVQIYEIELDGKSDEGKKGK